ncbi:MAG: sulfatase, partial [Myxococcota bacterium]
VARRDAGLRFEFTDDDAIRLRPVLGGFEVRDGVLRLTQHNNDLLVTDRPISIARDGYGAIELRIKMRKGSTAILYWCRYLVDLGTAEGRRKEKARIARLTVNTIPDGQFHTYVIDARTVLQKKTSPGSKIRSLGLLASSADGDVVEIDYLRFVPKREKYARRPAGRANETIAREMRSVLYVNTPLVLDYEIDVPDDEPTLRFGMGVLEDRDPVRFTASIDGGEGVEIVHAEEVSDTSAWRDAVIDLSRWSGRQVRVSLRADSAGGNVAFWSNPAVTSAQPSRINVILVLEDALRADHLSLYGHERETSPEKTRFARDGVVFEHAYSQATKTRPSCPSFMTSLFPSATGVVNHSTVLDERYLTLAEVMRSQGFVTASLPQNSNAGPAGGLHQGFSYVYDRSVASTSEALFGGAMLPWLEQHGDRNFFLYLHAINPHGVYDPKPPHDAFYRDEGPGKTPVKPDTRILDAKWVEHPTVEGRRLLYDGEVLDNDYWFGKLLADLERLGLRDDTLIVTIADHGEHLGEHGRWGHTPPGFVQVTHVPLVMV